MARIKASLAGQGDFLGKSGNSGNSDNTEPGHS